MSATARQSSPKSTLSSIATAIEAQRKVRESAPVTTHKRIHATIMALSLARAEIVALRRSGEGRGQNETPSPVFPR